ncbi:cobyrinate a,c-diamide synthase [Furfurilactobacillus entadae]|uniref:cobyrinate a,c-diamide synthase n=1 Tax=Furfurilactobacillus entadae TaxID=2922307 RepID=UPI0035EB70BE
MKAVLIAGTNSGSGKTTVTLGLLKALCQRGTVQPYKVGPDYVDTKFHTRITGRASRNLDGFLTPDAQTLAYLFTQNTTAVDFGVVEGVMGLYDGLGSDKDACSTAAMVKQLDLPVILVVDGHGMSTSVAALLSGYINFDLAVRIAGVIINNVMSESHYQLIKTAINRYLTVPVLGYLPHDESVALPSRQLGLVPDAEVAKIDDKINRLADQITAHVDLDQLVELMTPTQTNVSLPFPVPKTTLRIGIAQDEAFNFYYADNLALLRQSGATLVPFSPLHDNKLPEVDVLMLGGGYPEEFAAELAKNTAMRTAIRAFSDAGRPIYAECGGLMYLGRQLVVNDEYFDMVGVFPGTSTMTARLKRFGYCYATPTTATMLGNPGSQLTGHEFHHSQFEADTGLSQVLAMSKVRDGEVVAEWSGGYQTNATFASYLHGHFYQNKTFYRDLIRQWESAAHAN